MFALPLVMCHCESEQGPPENTDIEPSQDPPSTVDQPVYYRDNADLQQKNLFTLVLAMWSTRGVTGGWKA